MDKGDAIEHQRVIVEGIMGSGKSTTIRFIATSLEEANKQALRFLKPRCHIRPVLSPSLPTHISLGSTPQPRNVPRKACRSGAHLLTQQLVL